MIRHDKLHWQQDLASAFGHNSGRLALLATVTAVALALAAPAGAQGAGGGTGETVPAPAAGGAGTDNMTTPSEGAGGASAPEGDTATTGTTAGGATGSGATTLEDTATTGGDAATSGGLTGDSASTRGTDATFAAPSDGGGDAGADDERVPFKGQIVTQEEGTYTASHLMGAAVTGANGEQIGEVEDLIMTEDGQLEGVVVGVGGFLGIGEKQVAIQIDHATPNMAEGGVVVQLDKEALEKAPEFVELDSEETVGSPAETPSVTGTTTTTD